MKRIFTLLTALVMVFGLKVSAHAIPVFYDYEGICWDDGSSIPVCVTFGSSDGGQVTAFIAFDSSVVAPNATVGPAEHLASEFNLGMFTFTFQDFTATISSDLQSLTVTGRSTTNTINDGTFRYRVAERCPGLCGQFGASRSPIDSGSTPELIAAIDGTWTRRAPASIPFLCYKAKGKTLREAVSLADQFETKDTRVRKPNALCNPVDKNGEGISDPTAHLTCYKIKDVRGQPKFQPRDVLVENQFGEQTLTVLGGKRSLCVPSEKNLVPSALDLDHFKCYRARIKKGTPRFEPREVSLSDQFEEGSFKVKNPVRLCNPVSKNGEEITDSSIHLTCYKIKDVKEQPKFDKREVLIQNQLDGQTLKVLKPDVLCVPSSKIDLED